MWPRNVQVDANVRCGSTTLGRRPSNELRVAVCFAAAACSYPRAMEENLQEEDGERVLAEIARMPIQSWNYKAPGPSVRHLGPTAQDFYGAFPLGAGETT